MSHVLHESFGEDLEKGAGQKELGELILDNSLSLSLSESVLVEFNQI